MSYSEKDLETFQKNVLKSEDTFHFECEMCGRCCRNRQEPILITGADLYRIARALDITMMKAVEDNTVGYIGERPPLSHVYRPYDRKTVEGKEW